MWIPGSKHFGYAHAYTYGDIHACVCVYKQGIDTHLIC